MLNNRELLNYGSLDFKLRKTKQEYQYMLDIFQDGKKIGYLYFYKKPNKELEFIGIYLEKECRGLGIANISMKYLETLSLEEFNSSIIKTQCQEKPLTSAILVKNGFEVINGLRDETALYVGRLIGNYEGFTGVFSYNGSISDKVRKSTSLLQRQGIIVVDSLDLLIPESVVRTGYKRKYIKELN